MSSVLEAADARRARPRSAQNPQVTDELARPSPLTGIRLSQEVHTIYFNNQFVLLLTFNGPTPIENKHRDASPELDSANLNQRKFRFIDGRWACDFKYEEY
ncbi:hypothetical protein B0H14DRAFT_2573870 [Mycena olivaceomarginata]|nr:hypothetical protein B0H14DRAFT_2573870 [Mycena olivaceomarginata]